MGNIAYLAPEIPSLSATFVYEELLGLERRGYKVISLSVHRPVHEVKKQSKLANKTCYLYDSSAFKLIIGGVQDLFKQQGRIKAFSWLISDLYVCGIFKLNTWKLVFQFFVAVKVARKLIKEECSHLHVHFAHVPTQIAMYASALSGIPFTIMAHANDIFERGVLLKQKSERAKKLLTISDYNKSFLLSIGISSDNIDIVRCGVSFPISLNEKKCTETFVIGTLGRLVEKKGMDVLIESIHELIIAGNKIELQIVGDGPLRDELEGLQRKFSLEKVIQFKGSMGHSEVSQWMRTLDAFVLACKTDSNGDKDGIPVVLMEAMSQGIPVISTRLSGIPELILHEKTGLLAEPGDHHTLKNMIERLMKNGSLRKVLAETAARHVNDEFGQQVNLDRLIKQFELENDQFIKQKQE